MKGLSHQDSDIGFDMETLYELSMIDLTIMQQLRKYTDPVLRFALMEDINEQLPEGQKLTPTKFYYRLEKLEEKGILETRKGKKQRSVLINKTVKMDQMLASVLRSMIFSNLGFLDLLKDYIPLVVDEFSLSLPLDNLLLVLSNYEKIIDHRKIDLLRGICKNLAVLSDDDLGSYLKRHGQTDILQVRKSGHQIREASDTYDFALNFSFDPSLEGTMEELKEIERILKPGALGLFTSFSKPECTDHFILTGLIQEINTYSLIQTNDRQEILDALEQVGSKRGILENNGALVGWFIK